MILRLAVVAMLGALLLLFAVPAGAAADRGDGIHTESWFVNGSFLELAEDLAEATKAGKGYVLIWEQPGCYTCQMLHDVNFRDSRLIDYIKERFVVMTMNMFGEVDVVDFDGERMLEKDLAHKHKVQFTPTTIFFDEDGRETFRIPGYFKPYFYLAGYVYVAEKGYADEAARGMFPRWLQKNGDKVRAAYGGGPES